MCGSAPVSLDNDAAAVDGDGDGDGDGDDDVCVRSVWWVSMCLVLMPVK